MTEHQKLVTRLSRGSLAVWLAVLVAAIVAGVVGGLTLGGGGDDEASRPRATRSGSRDTGPMPGLTLDELLGVEVPFLCGDAEVVRLEDGEFECPEPDPRGAANHWVRVVGIDADDSSAVEAVVGDLTGDGADEGALIVSKNQGQAGNPLVFAYVYSSDGDLVAEVPDLPGRPTEVDIVDGTLELRGREFGDCNACPLGPRFTAMLRLEGDELVLADSKAPGSADDVAEIRAVARRYLEGGDVGCAFDLQDDTVFVSGTDPSWAHVGWYDPGPTPQCQGGTVALHRTSSGWRVSEGHGKCPGAVDEEFRARVGPNAGC